MSRCRQWKDEVLGASDFSFFQLDDNVLLPVECGVCVDGCIGIVVTLLESVVTDNAKCTGILKSIVNIENKFKHECLQWAPLSRRGIRYSENSVAENRVVAGSSEENSVNVGSESLASHTTSSSSWRNIYDASFLWFECRAAVKLRLTTMFSRETWCIDNFIW